MKFSKEQVLATINFIDSLAEAYDNQLNDTEDYGNTSYDIKYYYTGKINDSIKEVINLTRIFFETKDYNDLLIHLLGKNKYIYDCFLSSHSLHPALNDKKSIDYLFVNLMGKLESIPYEKGSYKDITFKYIRSVLRYEQLITYDRLDVESIKDSQAYQYISNQIISLIKNHKISFLSGYYSSENLFGSFDCHNDSLEEFCKDNSDLISDILKNSKINNLDKSSNEFYTYISNINFCYKHNILKEDAINKILNKAKRFKFKDSLCFSTPENVQELLEEFSKQDFKLLKKSGKYHSKLWQSHLHTKYIRDIQESQNIILDLLS